ncbi:MAG: ACT domain-containing protein [Robiginitomaculum sp.]|nr:ACT domain-containing protein [Robiginitomaculum sp.]MDQ7077263.1 ACT domain-containing protein [Robiginitomaculum sp.]
MNTQTLHIEFEPAEGAILRLIGLVERRGYDVRSISLPPSSNGSMSLDLGVMARDVGRDIGVLRRQIHRLVGVRRVLGGLDNTEQRAGGQNGEA